MAFFPHSCLYAITAAVVSVSVMAAPARAVEQLTLNEAVAQALSRNPELQAAERAIDAAWAREIQAKALPNPNLALNIDQVPIPNPGDGSYMVGISQPLLLAGQREARQEVSRLETKLAEFDRDVLRQDLVARIKDTYAQVLFEIARGKQAELDAQGAETLYQAILHRYNAGAVARVEVLQAEVVRNRANRELEAAKNRVILARGPLNVLLGREATSPLAVQDLPAPQGGTLPKLPDLVVVALKTRVELRRAETAIQREVLSRRLAQAGLWTGTEASLLAGAVQGQPGFSVSLTVPIPFYRQQGEIAEAEANRARTEAERDALRNAITQQVDQAYREAHIAATQANSFAKNHLPQAERLARNAQARFEAGEGSRLEVIEARRALSETQTEFQQSVLAYRQALHRLERAVGKELNAG